MALGELQFYSRALRRAVSFAFHVPDPVPGRSGPFPALLQLHGASDNHTSWVTRSKLPTYLDPLPLVVVMPDGALSSWSNWRLRDPSQRYEDFIMEDLIPACEHFFPIRPGTWAIGGLSMGGYGSLRLGLKYPERFASIYAHSSVFWGRDRAHQLMANLTDEERADADIYTHAARVVDGTRRPVLGLDCGTEDGLLDQNRAFHTYLETAGYAHEYREFPGGHTWEYWDEHVQHALRRHMAVFGPGQPPA